MARAKPETEALEAAERDPRDQAVDLLRDVLEIRKLQKQKFVSYDDQRKIRQREKTLWTEVEDVMLRIDDPQAYAELVAQREATRQKEIEQAESSKVRRAAQRQAQPPR